jgi:hypothetical protein
MATQHTTSLQRVQETAAPALHMRIKQKILG